MLARPEFLIVGIEANQTIDSSQYLTFVKCNGLSLNSLIFYVLKNHFRSSFINSSIFFATTRYPSGEKWPPYLPREYSPTLLLNFLKYSLTSNMRISNSFNRFVTCSYPKLQSEKIG